jgi:predicted molibdopterin-dependent oxidoreductase YjgC
MFRRLQDAQNALERAPVQLWLNGRAIQCRAGDSVAAALFAGDEIACRDTPVNGVPRGPYCMMGICYDCLVVIDGRQNQQACMTQVRDGMIVERQHGERAVTE